MFQVVTADLTQDYHNRGKEHSIEWGPALNPACANGHSLPKGRGEDWSLESH